MRQAGHTRYGYRRNALIVVLWRAGLRIQEALSLAETDLDQRRGSILVRRGKNDRRREVGMDAWAWSACRSPVLRDRRPNPRPRMVSQCRAVRAASRRDRGRSAEAVRAAPASPRARCRVAARGDPAATRIGAASTAPTSAGTKVNASAGSAKGKTVKVMTPAPNRAVSHLADEVETRVCRLLLGHGSSSKGRHHQWFR
jgi:integrase